MKTKLLSIVALTLLSTFAMADQNQSANVNGVTAESFSRGGDQGQLQAQKQGNANYQDFSNHSVNNAPAADMSRMVGAAIAPALTTTLTETCMGSTSVGAGWSGAALSFGTTWRDHACVRRLDAREIRTYGDVQAAKEIMCDSELVREAFKRVGRPCAVDGGTYVAVSQAPTPVATAPTPQPVATDVPVKDDQDVKALSASETLKKADEAREAIRTKYAF